MPLTVACAHVNFSTSCSCKLDANMSRRSKAIETEASSGPLIASQSSLAQTPVANDSRTQERCSFYVSETVREGISECSRRYDIFCIAPIGGPTRELRALTKILLA